MQSWNVLPAFTQVLWSADSHKTISFILSLRSKLLVWETQFWQLVNTWTSTPSTMHSGYTWQTAWGGIRACDARCCQDWSIDVILITLLPYSITHPLPPTVLPKQDKVICQLSKGMCTVLGHGCGHPSYPARSSTHVCVWVPSVSMVVLFLSCDIQWAWSILSVFCTAGFVVDDMHLFCMQWDHWPQLAPSRPLPWELSAPGGEGSFVCQSVAVVISQGELYYMYEL